MMARHARPGRVTWIGLRPERRAPMVVCDGAEITEGGLEGDRGRPGKRAVTLIQAEHIPVIAALSGHDVLDPALLRRNIAIEGINLVALKNARIMVGGAILEITGVAAPCSRMEDALGPGGYNAMRGHGGWCARVIQPGRIALGDAVTSARVAV